MSSKRSFGELKLSIIGVGGIGSTFSMMAGRFGFREICLYDDDTISSVNLRSQSFRGREVGQLKAKVVAKELESVSISKISYYGRRFGVTEIIDGLVVSGVDSLESRRVIWKSVMRNRQHVPLYIDGRLSRLDGEYFQILVVNPMVDHEVSLYEEWLQGEESETNLPRPTDVVAHTPYVLAGCIGSILVRWKNSEPYPWQVHGLLGDLLVTVIPKEEVRT